MLTSRGEPWHMFADLKARCLCCDRSKFTSNLRRLIGLHVEAVMLSETARKKNENDVLTLQLLVLRFSIETIQMVRSQPKEAYCTGLDDATAIDAWMRKAVIRHFLPFQATQNENNEPAFYAKIRVV